MMKSRKKALSLALTACLAAGMAWVPARTTEANEALNQVYQRILFDRINEIQRHQQEEREKEEQREREYAKRQAEAKEKAAEEAYIVPVHRLSAEEKAAFDAEHDARADAIKEAWTSYQAAMAQSQYIDDGNPTYYVGWGTSLFSKYRDLSANDWHYYADGYKTHIQGYYFVSLCPLPIKGKMETLYASGENTKFDPAMVYINEEGKATVTCPGRYYYYDSQTNGYKEADTPFYVGQVLWEGFAQKKVHSYVKDGGASLGDRNCLVLVNPHLWWNVKNPANGQSLAGTWSGYDIPVDLVSHTSRLDETDIELNLGYSSETTATGMKLKKAEYVPYISNPHYYNQKSY